MYVDFSFLIHHLNWDDDLISTPVPSHDHKQGSVKHSLFSKPTRFFINKRTFRVTLIAFNKLRNYT